MHSVAVDRYRYRYRELITRAACVLHESVKTTFSGS